MRVGDVIEGKYELVRLLGEGGMGAVWEGRHTRIGRRCALKFLHHELNRNSDIVARFMREAQAAAAIGSEHIVDVTDVGETDEGTPYLVMEYLEGDDLAATLKSQGPFQPARAARLVIQAARAVAAAHERGIVHRDLKPENLFLTRREDGSEWVKVLDFGIAKFRDSVAKQAPNLTATGTVLGTPFYMAPEQARGAKDLDHQADIYSTGVILYELLAGEPPFTAQSYNELIILIATSDPRPLRMLRPDISEAVERVVMTAMARDRAQRFQSMRQLIDALMPFAEDGKVTVPHTAVVTPTGPLPAYAIGTPPGGMPHMAGGTPAGGMPAIATSTPAGAYPVGPSPTPSGQQALLSSSSWPGTSAGTPKRSRAGLIVGAVVGVLVLVGGGVAAALVIGGGGGRPDTVVTTPPPPPPLVPPVDPPPVLPPVTQPVVPAVGGDAGPRAPVSPTPETVELRVQVEPASARISVDGIAVEGNPFVGRFPRDGARHRVEGAADGHVAEGRFVTFDGDHQLELSLRPERHRPSGTPAPPPPPETPPTRPGKRPGREIDRDNPYGGA